MDYTTEGHTGAGAESDTTWTIRDTKLHVPCYPNRRCKLKSCKVCSRQRARRIGNSIHNRTDSRSTYYHLTLTLPESAHTPAQQIRQLLSSLANIRRRQAWARHFAGGIRKVEVTRNRTTQLWHCHLHVFAQAATDTVPADTIAYLWLQQTGGEADIRAIDSDAYRRNAAMYVAKPPQSALFADAESLAEWIQQTRGMRLYGTFGNWRGRPQPQQADTPAMSDEITTIVNRIVAELSADTSYRAPEVVRQRLPTPAPAQSSQHHHPDDAPYVWRGGYDYGIPDAVNAAIASLRHPSTYYKGSP